jgi:hypothetical protein
MKKIAAVLMASAALSLPLAALAHEGMDMDHGMKMDHDAMPQMGKVVHEEVVQGVKAMFHVKDIRASMSKMGMKETNHIMVMFSDVRSHKPLSQGEARMKVVGPDKREQVKDLMAMEGGFGADFTMPAKGKYGVMTRFKAADGKVRDFRFWYVVK